MFNEYNLGDVVFVNQLDDYATVKAIIHEGIFSEDINIDGLVLRIYQFMGSKMMKKLYCLKMENG